MMKKLPKLLFVATTDSYLKWAIGLIEELPASWQSNLVIAKSTQNPSARQIEMAHTRGGSLEIQTLHISALLRRVKKERPDAVVVAATGPFLALLRWLLNFSSVGRKTKLISGSPGIAFHLVGESLRTRSLADFLLVASRAEKQRLADALKQWGSDTELGLATLPFLKSPDASDRFEGPETLVFAPQPDMPKTKTQRQAVLVALSKLKKQTPALTVVIKLRATKAERQTHFEAHPYQQLALELGSEGLIGVNDFQLELGRISDQLANKNATLLTLSSTAALESLALGNPTQIISDFGLSDELANSVFEDSGLVWKIEDFPLARLQKPKDLWLENNYFHKASEDDWIARVHLLVQEPRAGRFGLLPKQIAGSLFVGELLRVVFPNAFGEGLIRALRLLAGKGSS